MLEEKNLLCWKTSSGHCESESVETKQMSSILGNLSKILALDNVQTQCLIDCFCHPTYVLNCGRLRGLIVNIGASTCIKFCAFVKTGA